MEFCISRHNCSQIELRTSFTPEQERGLDHHRLHQEHSLQIRWHSIVLFIKRSMARRFLVSHPRIAITPVNMYWRKLSSLLRIHNLACPQIVLFVFENIPAFLSEIFPSIPMDICLILRRSCAIIAPCKRPVFSSSSLQDSWSFSSSMPFSSPRILSLLLFLYHGILFGSFTYGIYNRYLGYLHRILVFQKG